MSKHIDSDCAVLIYAQSVCFFDSIPYGLFFFMSLNKYNLDALNTKIQTMEQFSDKQTQITMRRSEMAFALKELPSDTLFDLFEAARWAASSYNEQPWRFYYAKREDSEAFVAVLNLLAEGNRVWAKDASVLIVSAAKKELHRTGKQNFYAMHDVGMATANLMIRATELGLTTHPMGGFDHKLMHDTLMMDDTEFPVAVIAIGYSGNVSSLPVDIQKRVSAPRIRNGINGFTFNVSDL